MWPIIVLIFAWFACSAFFWLEVILTTLTSLTGMQTGELRTGEIVEARSGYETGSMATGGTTYGDAPCPSHVYLICNRDYDIGGSAEQGRLTNIRKLD